MRYAILNTLNATRYTLYAIRCCTLYNCRDSSTNPLYFNKQTQSQVRQNQRKHLYYKGIRTCGTFGYSDKQTQTNPIKAKTDPIQSQLLQRVKLMQSVYLQRIMKKNTEMGQKNKAKTNPIQSQLFPLNDQI